LTYWIELDTGGEKL